MNFSYVKKNLLFSILTILLIFVLARLYYYLTDDFRVGNITYREMPYEHENALLPPTDAELNAVKSILNQKFYYMDKGAQSYAFASENGEYVLKFFKFKHLKPHWFTELLPSISPFNHFKEHSRIRKQRKLASLFEGYEIAFAKNKEGAQLFFLHLTPTDFLGQQTTVVDKVGRKHLLDMDKTVFLIQKKGETLRNRLRLALNQGDISAAQKDIALIINMYLEEYQKGIFDRDHGVLQNTGFIGSKPFHLDVGKLSYHERAKEKEFYKKDLELIIWKIDLWMKTNYPDYYAAISDFLKTEYFNIIGENLDISQMTAEIAKSRRNR